MDAVDAVLARMRADQGLARDRAVDADVDEAVAASPAALARERAAMRALAGTFREETEDALGRRWYCLLYTSPSPRDRTRSRMPSSA